MNEVPRSMLVMLIDLTGQHLEPVKTANGMIKKSIGYNLSIKLFLWKQTEYSMFWRSRLKKPDFPGHHMRFGVGGFGLGYELRALLTTVQIRATSPLFGSETSP